MNRIQPMTDKIITNRDLKILFELSKRHAYKQLQIILTDQGYLFKSLSEGYSKGVVFYKSKGIHSILSHAIATFFLYHKYMPSLINPKTFSEKLLWSKFFREFKIPESGNKLLTHKFIPTSLNKTICKPPIVWHSNNPILPGNNEIEPGFYYLKSNHGSGMYTQITYPLTEEDKLKSEALASSWLKCNYGLSDGEWFYSCFDKEILIERDISPGESSISWNYYVFNGKTLLLSIVQKTNKGVQYICYDENLIPVEMPGSQPPTNFSLNHRKALSLSLFAQAIADQSPFVRVDFMHDIFDNIFLGEITWTPLNGQSALPFKHELLLGEAWKHNNTPINHS